MAELTTIGRMENVVSALVFVGFFIARACLYGAALVYGLRLAKSEDPEARRALVWIDRLFIPTRGLTRATSVLLSLQTSG